MNRMGFVRIKVSVKIDVAVRVIVDVDVDVAVRVDVSVEVDVAVRVNLEVPIDDNIRNVSENTRLSWTSTFKLTSTSTSTPTITSTTTITLTRNSVAYIEACRGTSHPLLFDAVEIQSCPSVSAAICR